MVMAKLIACLVVSTPVPLSAIVNVHTELTDVKMMRKHMDSVQLGAGGQMKVVHGKSKPLNKAKVDPMKMCGYAFIDGTPSSNDCANSYDSIVEEKELCEKAARSLAGCPTSGTCAALGSPFELPGDGDTIPAGATVTAETRKQRPLRCYKEDAADGTTKYYFNNAGNAVVQQGPDGTSLIDGGTPICYSHKYNYTDAVTNSNTCNEDHLSKIVATDLTQPFPQKVEDDCRAAAQCISECEDANFLVTDAAEQLKHPQGCFRDVGNDGCFRLNKADNLARGTTYDATNLDDTAGSPICVYGTYSDASTPAPPPAPPATGGGE